MILDELLEFADATSLGTTTGRVLIGDVIDLGSEPQDFGSGRPMYLYVQVTTAVTGTSAAVSFELVSDAAATIATDGTATEHVVTSAFPEASLVQGWQFVAPLSVGYTDNEYERYLGLIANISGTAIAAGAINAGLTFDPKGWKSLPDAVN